MCGPLYSPDLSTLDYFLFPKLKPKIKWQLYVSIDGIVAAVTSELNSVWVEAFQKSFTDQHTRTKHYIDLRRDFTEA